MDETSLQAASSFIFHYYTDRRCELVTRLFLAMWFGVEGKKSKPNIEGKFKFTIFHGTIGFRDASPGLMKNRSEVFNGSISILGSRSKQLQRKGSYNLKKRICCHCQEKWQCNVFAHS